MTIFQQQRLERRTALAQQHDTASPPPDTQPEDEDTSSPHVQRPKVPPAITGPDHPQPQEHPAEPSLRNENSQEELQLLRRPSHLMPPTQRQPLTLDNYPGGGYLPTPFPSQQSYQYQFGNMLPRSQWNFHNDGQSTYTPTAADRMMYQNMNSTNFAQAPGFSGRAPRSTNSYAHNQPESSNLSRNRQGSNASEHSLDWQVTWYVYIHFLYLFIISLNHVLDNWSPSSVLLARFYRCFVFCCLSTIQLSALLLSSLSIFLPTVSCIFLPRFCRCSALVWGFVCFPTLIVN